VGHGADWVNTPRAGAQGLRQSIRGRPQSSFSQNCWGWQGIAPLPTGGDHESLITFRMCRAKFANWFRNWRRQGSLAFMEGKEAIGNLCIRSFADLSSFPVTMERMRIFIRRNNSAPL
jgi:hypothetical protein